MPRLTCAGLLLACIYSCAAPEPVAPIEPPPPPEPAGLVGLTRIVMLGTGTPNAEPDRSGPAVAIVVNDVPYVVDCGPGVVRRAHAAYEQGIRGLKISKLSRLFITHLHSDHTVGYPDFIFTPWTEGRDQPLEVYGPPGIRHMTENVLEAYDEDIRIRIDGLEPANTEGCKVNAHEIESGLVYRDANVSVRAFKVNHGSWEHAYGYRFETPDRVVVISGDTAPTRNLIESAAGCDVLIHEVYSQAGFELRSPEWQVYHASFHTSTVQLAAIAEQVRPKLLVLTHQLYWGSTDEELLDEIRERYAGRVVSAKDLDVF